MSFISVSKRNFYCLYVFATPLRGLVAAAHLALVTRVVAALCKTLILRAEE